MRLAPVLVLLLIVCLMACRGDERPGRFALLSPADGSPSDTPFSVTLRWTPAPGAAAYRLSLSCGGARVGELADLHEAQCRVPVRPGATYLWTVAAVDAGGKATPADHAFTFQTPEPALREVTDPEALFAGTPPHAHWVNMKPVPEDPSAPISPWFEKKRYDGVPPPRFEEARRALPEPIWEGHDDAISMYWFAWKTLFSVWLYPPPGSDHRAVSNLIGMPTWAGWGSTMVLDTAFILQFARYGQAAYPFITALDNCYARQHVNGYVCRETDNNNWEVSSSWPVNPPLLAWSEWSWYEVTGDDARLRAVFLPLVKQYEWYMLYQRRGNGLYWTNGLNEADDSPRNALAHSYLSTTTIQALSADILSRMADRVGRPDLAGWFRGEARRLKEAVNTRFWDADHRLYNDLGVDGRPITRTPSGGLCKHGHVFWPLLARIAPRERVASLAAHLSDPASFERTCGIASLSADSEGYNRENGAYWRGSVWPPIQCMVVKGLKTSGQEDLAARLARKYYDAFLAAYRARGDITEFLAPDRPEMMGVGSFVGWGGVAPIGFLIEDILGLRPDALHNRVVWRLRLGERHGIRGLRFGQRTVSLACGAAPSSGAARRVTVESDGDFDLWLDLPAGTVKRHMHAGRTEALVRWTSGEATGVIR